MRRLYLSVLCVTLAVASAHAAPGDEAADVFRKYVAAIRAGSVDEALKLVEPVPESCKPLLRASVEGAVAVEKVKTEWQSRWALRNITKKAGTWGSNPMMF
jgi:hypothetical protein